MVESRYGFIWEMTVQEAERLHNYLLFNLGYTIVHCLGPFTVVVLTPVSVPTSFRSTLAPRLRAPFDQWLGSDASWGSWLPACDKDSFSRVLPLPLTRGLAVWTLGKCPVCPAPVRRLPLDPTLVGPTLRSRWISSKIQLTCNRPERALIYSNSLYLYFISAYLSLLPIGCLRIRTSNPLPGFLDQIYFYSIDPCPLEAPPLN